MHIKSPPSCWTLMTPSFYDIYCVCVFIHSVLTPCNLMWTVARRLCSLWNQVGEDMGKLMFVTLMFGRNQCNAVKQLSFS